MKMPVSSAIRRIHRHMQYSAVLFLTCLLTLIPASALRAQEPAGQDMINIAVVSPSVGVGIYDDEAMLIADRLRVELFNTGRANVMEREQMNAILKEQGFQQSGVCSDAACAVQIGQLLGVKAMVTGSIGRLGSVYMVNFRLVDVQTGKFTAAVSRDVKGDIEDLIGYLKDIAREIVMSAGAPAAVPAATAANPRPAAGLVKDKLDDRNANLKGVRVQGGTQWGPPSFFLDGAEYPLATNNDSIPRFAGYLDTVEFTSGPVVRLDIGYQIRTGPFLAIEIGPNFQWQNMTSTRKSTSSSNMAKMNLMYGQAGISLGLCAVKRIYPLKLNAGAFIDLGFAWFSSRIDSVDAYGKPLGTDSAMGLFGTDMDNFHGAFGHGYGARLGAEYLFNKHIGFDLAFMFRFSMPQFQAANDIIAGQNSDRHIKYLLNYTSSNPDYHPKIEIRLPMFGFSGGLNFYF